MNRDWQLIRSLLRLEDLGAWESQTVLEHYALCHQAGYMHTTTRVERLVGADASIIHPTATSLTDVGREAAGVLASKDDLDAVLEDLHERGLGAAESNVFEQMRRKARARAK